MNNEDTTIVASPCTDENGKYPRPGNEIVGEISNTECQNLEASSGLSGSEKNNEADLQAMLCDIKQGVDFISQNRALVIAANDASKCQDDDDPTLASMWSRILRFSQAVACIICNYDPFIANILRMGKYPQILMGSVQEGGYPVWVNPDELPTQNSSRPVTSGGVVDAIKDALLGVWHPYEQYPHFGYFAQTLNGTDDPYNLESQDGMAEGDTALVANDGTRTSAVYTYTDGAWVFTKQLTNEADGLTNFAVTNILKGHYATKDVYYFDGGETPTWDVMDSDLGNLEDRISQLEEIYKNAVVTNGSDEQMILTTAASLTAANAVPCDNDKPTIVLITG